MKKIFLFILLFICLKGFSQYPSKQTLGSPTSKLEVLGGVHAVKGLINGRYADTTAANLGYIDSYHGSQIFTTTDKILWLRDSVLNKWVQVGSGGTGITALTGDGTATGPGSVPLTLATVNSNVGSFTYGSFTVNAKGLITAASNGSPPVLVSDSAAMLANYVRNSRLINTGYGLTGGGNLTADRTFVFDSATVFPQVRATITASNGLTKVVNDFRLGQTVGAAGNPAAFTSNREMSIGDYYYELNNRTGTFSGADSSRARFAVSGNAMRLQMTGKHGGALEFYMKTTTTAFPGINFFSPAGNLLNVYGYHYETGAVADKHVYITDMRDSTWYSSIETSGTATAIWWSGFQQDHLTQQGIKGRFAVGTSTILSNNLVFGDFDNFGSTYLRDSLSLAWTPASASSTDSVLVKSGNLIKARAQSDISGGGGSQGLQDVITVDPIIAINSTISLAADLFIGDNIGVDFKNSTSTLELFGPTIKLNRGWSGAAGTPGLPAGTSTDSVVTINQADGQIRMRAASSFSGSGEINTASNLGGGLANYSTKVGVDLQFNSFFATDFDLGSNLISIDYANGQKASNTVSGFVSATTQTFSAGKTFNAPMNVKDAGGAYLQGFQIINSASVAQTSILHEGGSFFIGLATAASGADASGDFIQRIRAYEETATGTNPIIELGDNDLRINHDGTANYAGNYGIATAVPTEKLHVTGNIRFSGALMPNNTAGTAGQVLTSAGAGTVPTWTTPSAGGSGVLYYRDPLFEVNDSTLGVDSTKMKIWPGSIIAGATMSLGSDATGDIYYRNSGGVLTRLGVGSNGNVLTLASGLPSWAAIPATTWNSITSPTGTQTLTFDDAELNAWTVNSNTETFHSITANSLTTGTLQYLGSSSLTSGVMQRIEMTGNGSAGRLGSYISSTGTNSTSAANTVGVYANIANDGTTSKNYGFWANVNSGASINYAFYGEAGDLHLAAGTAKATGFLPLTTNVSALGTTSQQFADLFLGEGAVINFDNGDATITQVGDAVTLAGAALTARWTPRVGSTTSSATPTINTDNTDIYKLTAQTADITSFTTNLSGTPVDGDILEIQITGTAARALTFGASFVSSTVTIPTTTVTTATLTVIFQWFTTSSYGANKWVCVNSF